MSEAIDEAAARWHQAQQHDDMDWDGFVDWLEADPRHRDAYDAIALLDAQIDAARPLLVDTGVPDVAPVRRMPRWALGSGLAAAAAVAVAFGFAMQPRPPEAPAVREFASAPGATRTVQVAGGISATLGAGSRLSVPANGAPMRLDGSAYFTIRHDPAREVAIAVGPYRIRDVGTRFAVSSADGVLNVSVEEGGVALQAPGQAGETQVAAGQQAQVLPGGTIELRPVRAATIASWRSGRFAYDDVPLALVVGDIARYTGQPVSIDAPAGRRRFSGVLAPGERQVMVSTLTQLTGLHAQNDGRTIRLVDRPSR